MTEVTIAIRWRDVDNYGHVNNAVYLNYLEEARDRLAEELFGDEAWDFVLARVAIDYRRELTQADRQVVVRAGVRGFGRSSIRTWETVATLDGVLRAEAASVMVPRGEDGGSRPLTEDERSILERAVSAPGGPDDRA